MKNVIILYHNDLDGFGAAWAAWKKFGDKADYIPVQYKGKTDFLPKKLKNKELYLVDLCFDADTMKQLLKENKKVIVIDHHIGRKDEVKISTDYLFSVDNSGAGLAWKYFFPKNKTPKILKHIEDYDIWKLKLPRTRELLASLHTYEMDFKKWDRIAVDFESAQKRKKYLIEGTAIVKYQDDLIKKIIEYGEKAIFEGHKIFAVNSSILESEIGNHIVKNKKIIGLIWSYKNSKKGFLKCSLRGDGKVNLSDLAKKYGGGGHRAAAGFFFNTEINSTYKKDMYGIKLPWEKTK